MVDRIIYSKSRNATSGNAIGIIFRFRHIHYSLSNDKKHLPIFQSSYPLCEVIDRLRTINSHDRDTWHNRQFQDVLRE